MITLRHYKGFRVCDSLIEATLTALEMSEVCSGRWEVYRDNKKLSGFMNGHRVYPTRRNITAIEYYYRDKEKKLKAKAAGV